MTTTESAQVRKKPLSWLAQTLIFTNAGLLCLVSFAFYSFGSVDSALAYVRGDRLMADARSRSFGEVEKGQHASVVFELANTSDREINVLGARTGCTCLFAEGLPLPVPPRSRRSIRIAVRTDGRAVARSVDGRIREAVGLYTDFPGQPEVELHVLGRVSSSQGQPDKPASDGG
jgi:hypothetical protein